MLNKQYTSMLQEKDVIFEIFQYATERAKVVGAENIYDFSLGNPSAKRTNKHDFPTPESPINKIFIIES